MHRIWNALTVRRLAIALAGVATVAIVVDATSGVLKQWTPNIATEAISLLVTIAVVD
jgi:hypothetical protein